VDNSVYKDDGELNRKRVSKLLEKALEKFFGGEAVDGLRELFHPGEIIGIKINGLSGRMMSTSVPVVYSLIELLSRAGIKKNKIVIWDRFNRDLKRAGYTINYRGQGPLCYGTDAAGFDQQLLVYRSIGSLITRIITNHCDSIINIPVMKDHGIVGVTLSMKNFFGAIHNPNKYHINAGNPYVADLYSHALIRKKVKLTILDGLMAQYEGGPPYHPQWTWKYSGFLLSEDPVALDYTAWRIIEGKRRENGLPSLKEMKRNPDYIFTAEKLGIGTADPEKIVIIDAV
jgi:uncharacterized protein (DUF362 family)